MLVAPDLWPRFRPKDFQGVLIDLHSCYVDEDPLNQSIREIAQQDDLRILTLNQKVISAKTFSTLGRLSRLRWLDLTHITIDESLITGKPVSQLDNLSDLKVLRLSTILAVTPALKTLSESSSLRRFALCGTDLTPDDIQYVSQLRSLEVLSLHRDDLPKIDVLSELEKLPNLKCLIIDARLLDNCKVATISKLHNLTLITDGNKIAPEIHAELLKNRSVKLIESKSAVTADGDFFDPLKADPGTVLSAN